MLKENVNKIDNIVIYFNVLLLLWCFNKVLLIYNFVYLIELVFKKEKCNII